MPEVMDWPQGETLAVVARAVQHLREGRLVAFPSESVYMIAAGALAVSKHDKNSGARTLSRGTLRGRAGPDALLVRVRCPNTVLELALARIFPQQRDEKFVSRPGEAILLSPAARFG